MGFPTGPDPFTGANGTELHTYNAGWTKQTTDQVSIQSNTAQLTGGGSEGAYKWDGDGAFANDQYAQAVYANTGNYGGVTVRMSGVTTATTNGYIALVDAGKIDLQKITNGTRSNLQAQMTGAVANADTVKLEVIGTAIKVYVNAVQQGTTVTDSSFASGQPGIYFLNSLACALDDWTADTIPTGGGGGGGSPTYPQLERGVRGLARGLAGGLARAFVRRDRIFVPAYAGYALKAAA
jgi:hypothetical protein